MTAWRILKISKHSDYFLFLFFDNSVRQRLLLSGFDQNDLEVLERKKTLGTLIYCMPRQVEWKDRIDKKISRKRLPGQDERCDFSALSATSRMPIGTFSYTICIPLQTE